MRKFKNAEEVLKAVREAAVEFGSFDHGLTVNSRGLFGNPPIMVVIHWGDIDAVQLLLAAGADIQAVGELGNTPLHEAIHSGEFKIARLLIAQGADQSIRNADGKLPRDLCWEGEWPDLFGPKHVP